MRLFVLSSACFLPGVSLGYDWTSIMADPFGSGDQSSSFQRSPSVDATGSTQPQRHHRRLLSAVVSLDSVLEETLAFCGDALEDEKLIPGANPNGTTLRTNVITCTNVSVVILSAGNPVLIPYEVKTCSKIGDSDVEACYFVDYSEIKGTNTSEAVSCEVRVQPADSASSTDFACETCNLCTINGTSADQVPQVGTTVTCDNLKSVVEVAPELNTDVCTPSVVTPPPGSTSGAVAASVVSTLYYGLTGSTMLMLLISA